MAVGSRRWLLRDRRRSVQRSGAYPLGSRCIRYNRSVSRRKFLVSIPRFVGFPINRHKLVHIRTLGLFLTPFLHTLRIFDKPSKTGGKPLIYSDIQANSVPPFRGGQAVGAER